MDVLDFLLSGVAIVLALTVGVFVLPVAGIVLGIRWIWRHARGDKGKSLGPGSAQPYAFLEEYASKKDVEQVASAYVEDETLGPYAQNVLKTFEDAERRRTGIFSILEQEFGTTSLTWDKFSAPVEVTLETIQRNAAQIANRIQAFDAKEFRRMGRLQNAGAYDENSPETKRLLVMNATLEEMDDIQAANNRLITELEHLQAELTKMSGAGYDTETEQLAAEISKLAEETKYYA
jgi:hypothetical protein